MRVFIRVEIEYFIYRVGNESAEISNRFSFDRLSVFLSCDLLVNSARGNVISALLLCNLPLWWQPTCFHVILFIVSCKIEIRVCGSLFTWEDDWWITKYPRGSISDYQVFVFSQGFFRRLIYLVFSLFWKICLTSFEFIFTRQKKYILSANTQQCKKE